MMAKGIYFFIHVLKFIIARLLNLDPKIVDIIFVDIAMYNRNPKASSSL